MRWTIIGTGWISEKFAQSLINNSQEIVGVVSRSKVNGVKFAQKFGIENVFTKISEDKLSEVVYIATPNALHYKQALEAIELKKLLMIEKPLTHSYQTTKELFAKAKEANIQIMEAYAHITQNFYLQRPSCISKLDVNYMQLSSKIKNNTYLEASSFSKEMFGGVVADLGVYPLSCAVVINGDVKHIEVTNPVFYNEVIVEVQLKLVHTNDKVSNIKISKIKDGDNALYLDDKKVLEHLNFSELENRMDQEVAIFISKDEQKLDHFKNVSLKVARLVDEIHTILYKEN